MAAITWQFLIRQFPSIPIDIRQRRTPLSPGTKVAIRLQGVMLTVFAIQALIVIARRLPVLKPQLMFCLGWIERPFIRRKLDITTLFELHSWERGEEVVIRGVHSFGEVLGWRKGVVRWLEDWPRVAASRADAGLCYEEEGVEAVEHLLVLEFDGLLCEIDELVGISLREVSTFPSQMQVEGRLPLYRTVQYPPYTIANTAKLNLH